MQRLAITLATLVLCLFLRPAAAQPSWPQWRGPHANGSVGEGKYPVDLDPKNALWTAPLLGKGSSTPMILDRHVILTVPTNGVDSVVSFDWYGKRVWCTTFGPESPGAHPNGSGSNASPATDGKLIFVRYKSGTLAALDPRGATLWQTNLTEAFGPEKLYWDQAISPVPTQKDVVVACMQGGDSWLAGFDKLSGRLDWKVERNYETPVEGDQAYTTPLVIQQQGKECVLVWGAEHLTAHDTLDGKLLWSCGDFNPKATPNVPAVASPVIAGDVAVVASGRADRNQPRLYGIRLGGTGDVTATNRVWMREDTGTFVPTPAEYRGRVYLLRDRGELECLEPATGQTIWRGALPKASFNYYSSPLVAGDKLYAAREDGTVFVVGFKDKFEILSENHLGEHVIASPVAVSGRLFIRGQRHLFCFAGS